jgi:hypothetical protein
MFGLEVALKVWPSHPAGKFLTVRKNLPLHDKALGQFPFIYVQHYHENGSKKFNA